MAKSHMDTKRIAPAPGQPGRLSIDHYQRIRQAQATKAKRSCGKSLRLFKPPQQRYLDHCLQTHVDPDPFLLNALRDGDYMLRLDTLGKDELDTEMRFLRKGRFRHRISVSLGSIEINRDVRSKLERVGLTKAYAYSAGGARLAVRCACLGVLKSPKLRVLEVRGVQIDEHSAILLAKAISASANLEVLDICESRLRNDGIAAITISLGQKLQLRMLNLSGCELTDGASEHIAKIVTLHGCIKDDQVWSTSLRSSNENSPDVRPKLLIDLSNNMLSDETADALATVLFHDKWTIGLNLRGNPITVKPLVHLLETAAMANSSLCVIVVPQLQDQVAHNKCARRAYELMESRLALLAQVLTASRGMLSVKEVLITWGLEKTMIDINSVNSQASPDDISERSVSSLSQPEYSKGNDTLVKSPLRSDGKDSQVIEFLVRQVHSLNAQHCETKELLLQAEEENKRLRRQLASATHHKLDGLSPVEAGIIAELENTISNLADQLKSLQTKEP